MSLPRGTRLGRYEITGTIGAGGMGEVYRARDTRLGRDVAVKCLNPDSSADRASQLRLEREARACASLSHPNICPLFDVGEHNGTTFLVMELLTGETLAARLSRSRLTLPVDEVLLIGTQIADAIAYAHQHQVVHRDLKPANIMLTRDGARLLDFGIAKPSADAENTRSVITLAHERIGTPAYMAPEQLTGVADHRSDIYALGAVIFEMLTGAKAFDTSATLAAVRPDIPPALARAVRKCLEKDALKRWQSAADLADELRWIASLPTSPSGSSRPSGRWTAIAIGVALIVALIAIPRGRPTPALEQWSFLLPPNFQLPAYNPGVALSPDGSMIAFVAVEDNTQSRYLFVKRSDASAPRLIPNTDGAIYPFFSPDSGFVAFFSAGQLKRWAVGTDSVTSIAENRDIGDGSAASWSADNSILFGLHEDRPSTGIQRFIAGSGGLEILTRPDNAKNEQTHFGPQTLADGRILYTVRSIGPKGVEFNVVSRDASGKSATLVPGASLARLLPDKRLIYQTGNALTLADFAPETAHLSNPRKILDDVFVSTGGAAWGIAGDSLAYRPIEPPRRRLVWVDRSGRITPVDTELRDFSSPSLSPENDRVAVAIQGQGAGQDVWILDLDKHTLAPLTRDAVTGYPVWSGDGKIVMSTRLNGAGRDVIMHVADGSAPDSVLLHTGQQTYGAAFAPGDRELVVMTPGPGTGADIAVVDRGNPATLRYIVQTPGSDFGGRVSPNGKWLSYFSDLSGRMELYVTPFPNGGPKWRLSQNGAREAVWSRDSRELFFRLEDRMYSIAVHDSASFSWDPPRELFTGIFFRQGGPGNVHYDVAADGRFLMVQETPRLSPSIRVVKGWQALVQ